MKQLKFIILLSAMFLFCKLSFAAVSQDLSYSREYAQGEITAHISLNSAQSTIAKPFHLEITITSSKDYQSEVKYSENENLEIADNSAPPAMKTLENGFAETKFVAEIFAKSIGEIELNNIVISYWRNTTPDEKQTLEVDSIPLTVKGFLSDSDYQQIDEKGIEVFFDENFEIDGIEKLPIPKWVWVAAVSLFLLILIIIIVICKRKPKAKQAIRISMAAHEIAESLLSKLDTENLPQTGKHKLYYQKLGNILRYYIEYRFGINAPDKTTEEFFDSLGYANILDEATKLELRGFLSHCDMVKFAKLLPTIEAMDSARNLAGGFIDKTHDTEANIDITDDKTIREMLGL